MRTRPQRPGAFRAAIATFVPVMRTLTRPAWRGGERLPARGGVLVCANHVSQADPLAVADFLVATGRRPTFLAKASLFEIPVVGAWIAACGQIPVHRGEARAADAIRDAVAAIGRGECVVVMPESTVTKDPDGWPMTAKTGAARIALATRAPVLPLSQWGAQELLDADLRFHPLRRPRVSMLLGEPVDLADLHDRPVDAQVLREATDRIMRAVVDGVAELRGRPAPDGAWDLRAGRRVTGPVVRRDDPASGGPTPDDDPHRAAGGGQSLLGAPAEPARADPRPAPPSDRHEVSPTDRADRTDRTDRADRADQQEDPHA